MTGQAQAEIAGPAGSVGGFMGGLARLILALVCLAVSLTAFIRAPNLPAWMLLLGVTEFGQWFALVALAVAIPFQFHPLGLAASGVAIVVAGLFLSTLAQALPFGARLPAQLQAAFGPVPPAGRPFFWRSLIFGVREKQVGPETFISSEGEGYSLRLNFFRSVRPDPAPCVLVLHTGVGIAAGPTNLRPSIRPWPTGVTPWWPCPTVWPRSGSGRPSLRMWRRRGNF